SVTPRSQGGQSQPRRPQGDATPTSGLHSQAEVGAADPSSRKPKQRHHNDNAAGVNPKPAHSERVASAAKSLAWAGASAPATTPARPHKRKRSRRQPGLSAWTDKWGGWRCLRQQRRRWPLSTRERHRSHANSFFEAREEALGAGGETKEDGASARASASSCSASQAKRGRQGNGGDSDSVGLGCRGEITHLRLALPCKGNWGEVVERYEKISAPVSLLRGEEQRWIGLKLEKKNRNANKKKASKEVDRTRTREARVRPCTHLLGLPHHGTPLTRHLPHALSRFRWTRGAIPLGLRQSTVKSKRIENRRDVSHSKGSSLLCAQCLLVLKKLRILAGSNTENCDGIG
ncbi:hypothetical protein CVT26_004158, partial [Gymnopilus dilepis]